MTDGSAPAQLGTHGSRLRRHRGRRGGPDRGEAASGPRGAAGAHGLLRDLEVISRTWALLGLKRGGVGGSPL